MNHLAQHIVRSIGRLVGWLSNETISLKFNALRLYLHSGFYAHRFKSFGKNSILGLKMELRGCQYINIGENVKIGNYGILTAWDNYRGLIYSPSIDICDNVSIGHGCHITCVNKITIGEGTLIGSYVLITDNAHGQTDCNDIQAPAKRQLVSKGEVKIGKNVWIGSHACIMPGVEIGDDSIIGANSVVTHNVQPHSVVAGNPARQIK